MEEERAEVGGWRGGSADSIPRPPPVRAPLAVTCSARAAVSTCHAGRRAKSEPDPRHNRELARTGFFQTITLIQTRPSASKQPPPPATPQQTEPTVDPTDPRGCTCCPPAVCAPSSPPPPSSTQVSFVSVKPGRGGAQAGRAAGVRRKSSRRSPAGATRNFYPAYRFRLRRESRSRNRRWFKLK